MITINKRITHDKIKKRPDNRTNTHSIRPEGSAERTRSFETQAQEPARLRLWDGAAAARARRPVGRGAGMQHQLARSTKLRDLHAAVPGPDGRDASRVRVRRTGARVAQEIQDPGLINRGPRAPSPIKYYRRASSWASSADKGTGASEQALKPWAASSRTADPGASITARGSWAWTMMNVFVGCVIWKPIWCGEKVILLVLVSLSSTVKNPCFTVYPTRSGKPKDAQDSTRVHLIFGVAFLTFCQSFDSGFKLNY